jgi:hypothetical protein
MWMGISRRIDFLLTAFQLTFRVRPVQNVIYGVNEHQKGVAIICTIALATSQHRNIATKVQHIPLISHVGCDAAKFNS